MNKRFHTMLLGALLASPLAVHAEGFYAGLNFGKAKTSADIDNSLFVTTSRTNGVAIKAYGGYELTRHWGIEAGYANLGASRDVINDSLFASTDVASYHFTSFYLAGTGSLPLGDRFSLFAKLGIAANRIAGMYTINNVAGEFDGGKVGFMEGVGVNFNVDQRLAVRLEYEYFGSVSSVSNTTTTYDIKGKGRLLSLGLNYKF